MPAALVHTLVDQFFILIRGRRDLSLMPFLIAKQASRNDIFLCSRSSIMVSYKMLAGTLKTFGLVNSNLVFRNEFKRVF